jgi:hypothetical protein
MHSIRTLAVASVLATSVLYARHPAVAGDDPWSKGFTANVVRVEWPSSQSFSVNFNLGLDDSARFDFGGPNATVSPLGWPSKQQNNFGVALVVPRDSRMAWAASHCMQLAAAHGNSTSRRFGITITVRQDRKMDFGPVATNVTVKNDDITYVTCNTY